MPEEEKCEICNISLSNEQEKIEHGFSLMHHIKLDQVKKRRKHSCSLCSVEVGCLNNYVGHLNGIKHKKQLLWQRQQWKKRPPSNADVPITIDIAGKGKEVNKNVTKTKKVKPQRRNGAVDMEGFEESNLQSNKNPAEMNATNQKDQMVNQRTETCPTKSWQTTYHTLPQNNVPVYQHYSWFPPPFRPPGPDFSNDYNISDTSFHQQYHWGYNRFPPAGNFSHVPGFQGYRHHFPFGSAPCANNWTSERADAVAKSHQPVSTSVSENNKDFESATNGNLMKTGIPPLQSRTGDSERFNRKLYLDTRTNVRNANRDNSKSGSKSSYVHKSSTKSTHKSESGSKSSYAHKSSTKTTRDSSSSENHGRNGSKIRTTGTHARRRSSPRDSSSLSRSRTESDGKEQDRLVHKPEVLADSVEIGGHCVNNIKVTVPGKSPPKEVEKKVAKSLKDSPRNEHTYFVSSDSNNTDDSSVESNAFPPRKKRKGEISSHNKYLISKLVNFPRTRRQQYQLGNWIQEHTRAKKKLILPRFNLQLASASMGKDEDSVVEGMVCEVVDSLPEHVFKELVEVLNRDCGLQSVDDHRQEECGTLPPWLDFLVSLSRAPSPTGLGNTDAISVSVEDPSLLSSVQGGLPLRESEVLNPVSTIIVKSEFPGECSKTGAADGTSIVETLQTDVNSTTASEMTSEVRMETMVVQIKTEPPDPPPEEIVPDITEQEASSAQDNSDKQVFPETSALSAPEEQNCGPSSRENESGTNVSASLLGSSPSAGFDKKDSPSADEGGAEAKKSKEKAELLQQTIVSRLVEVSKKEEELRKQLEILENSLHQTQQLLSELTTKKKKLRREELDLRGRRMKLLKTLQESMERDPVQDNQEGAVQQPSLDGSLTYLGSMDFDFDLLSTTLNAASKPKKRQTGISKKNCKQLKQREVNKLTKGKKGNGKAQKSQKRKKKQQSSSAALEADADFLRLISSPKSLAFQNVDLPSADFPLKLFLNNVFKEFSEKLSCESSRPVEDTQNAELLDNSGATTSDCSNVKMNLFQAHESAVIDLKVCGGFAYTCSSDKLAKRWDIKNPSDCVTYGGHDSTVTSLQITTIEGDKAFVFTASHDQYLRCFDSVSGTCLNQFDTGMPIICMTKAWGKLYLGLNDGTIIPFSLTNNRLLEVIQCSQSAISKIITATEGLQRLLCVSSYDETVTVRNASTGLLLRCLEGKIKPPCFMQVSGDSIYTTTGDKRIVVHNLSTGEMQREVKCQSSCMALCISGDFIFTCSYDGLIRCYRKKSWLLHALYYGAGKSMTMCMEICERQVYTGNRKGFVESFVFDPSVVILCKFQTCNSPFGRILDLRFHVEEIHFPKLSSLSSWKDCPWRGCGVQLTNVSFQEVKDHVLLHCDLLCK